ncbi:MAG: DUF3750 domain-containing protein [Cyclobacteriaceae bacterium]|nr:DUF3750 domain-containing protein [Cyclobacteriaceae bacterium]
MDRHISGRRKKGSVIKWFGFTILFLFGCVVAGSIKRKYEQPLERSPSNTTDQNWAAQSYGFAPHPHDFRDPIIQVYASRTRGSKGAFAVHTWIATKRSGADRYIISQVIGWRLRRNGTALFSESGVPDKEWYGNEPMLLLDLRGNEVEQLIEKVEVAVNNYPWAGEYTVWPGPNSKTFIAWLGLQIPELNLDLPSTAIGKDWRPVTETFGMSTSGTGVQASLYGLFGATVGLAEGLELNILGLSVELDVLDLALELPGIGRIGKGAVFSAQK